MHGHGRDFQRRESNGEPRPQHAPHESEINLRIKIIDFPKEIYMFCVHFRLVIVAQLVRAPDCGSGGRGFEPRLSPVKKVGSGREKVGSRQQQLAVLGLLKVFGEVV
jgi:hypothetical protein